MFRADTKILIRLIHPGIAMVHNFPGGTMTHFYNRVCPRPAIGLFYQSFQSYAASTQRAMHLFGQNLEMIEDVHRLGVIHRNIKDPNIMFTASDVINVVGFGITQVLGDGAHNENYAPHWQARIRVAGARLHGYQRQTGQMNADDYTIKIVKGELGDPTLSFQIKRGFHVIAVCPMEVLKFGDSSQRPQTPCGSEASVPEGFWVDSVSFLRTMSDGVASLRYFFFLFFDAFTFLLQSNASPIQ